MSSFSGSEQSFALAALTSYGFSVLDTGARPPAADSYCLIQGGLAQVLVASADSPQALSN